jgi:hypothetical protein
LIESDQELVISPNNTIGNFGRKRPIGKFEKVEEYYRNGELFNCKKFHVPKPIQTIK